MRVVFDTNVLIDGFSDDYNPQSKLLRAATSGKLTAVVSAAVIREYRKILRRLINDPDYQDRVNDFLRSAEEVQPDRVDVQIDDMDDRKFIAAAVSGQASHIVSRDRHLLDIGEFSGVRIVTPQEAWVLWQEQSDESGEWQGWVEGLGLT